MCEDEDEVLRIEKKNKILYMNWDNDDQYLITCISTFGNGVSKRSQFEIEKEHLIILRDFLNEKFREEMSYE